MTVDDYLSHLREGGQILKTRDDQVPVFLKRDAGTEETAEPLKLSGGATCSWTKANETLGLAKLRTRIKPWLTAALASRPARISARGNSRTSALERQAVRHKHSPLDQPCPKLWIDGRAKVRIAL